MDKTQGVRDRGQGWPKQQGHITVPLPKTGQIIGSKIKIRDLYMVSLKCLLAIQVGLSSGEWSHGSRNMGNTDGI